MKIESSTLKQLQKLPRLEGAAFVGARRVLRDRGLALSLWLDQDGRLRNLEVAPLGATEADDLLRSLTKAMLKPAQSSPCRPAEVLVADDTLARELGEALDPLAIPVGVAAHAEKTIDAMLGALSLEGYLLQDGVTPDDLLELFELAGELFELGAWETLSSRLVVELEGLLPEPISCQALGGQDEQYGLALRGTSEEEPLVLRYALLDDLAPQIMKEIDELGLPLCQDDQGELRAPLLRRGQALPRAAELQLFRRALAALVEALQSGSPTVRVGETEVRVRYQELRARRGRSQAGWERRRKPSAPAKSASRQS